MLATLFSLINPGSGHLRADARVLPATLTASTLNVAATSAFLAIMAPVRNRSDLAEVVASRTVFLGLGLTLAIMAVTRLYTAIDVAWLTRPAGTSRQHLAAAITVGALIIAGVTPLGIAANYVWEADQAVEKVFGEHDAVTAFPTPLTTGASDEDPGDSTAPTTLPLFGGEERVSILLLGGDAGPDRPGLRTDSIIVVSINAVTGDTAVISIPRNMDDLPFPEGTPLHDRFPEGFNGLANAVYSYGDQHRDLLGGVDDAGAQAVKLGVSQLLGIPIHYYVLVDMAGFVDIVDSLGGIDIYVPKRVPTPGNPRGAKHPVPDYIEKGQQHMDGTLALAYARTREADDDHHRMARQQCLLGAVAGAATPMTLALGFADVVAAFGDAVITDIPRDELDDFSHLIDRFLDAGGIDAVHKLHLGKPLVDPYRWKAREVRELVADALLPVVLNDDIPLLEKDC